jgi:Na+-transporting NADH:ubiquinone oxidoreductase subunit C
MGKDSTLKTLFVAVSLCVVCSVLVSGAAVSLRPRQVENQKLDIKKNLLLASGLLENASASKEEIESAFEVVKANVIDFENGEVLDIDPESYDERREARDPKTRYTIPADKDVGKLRVRAPYGKVYTVEENGELSMIILPVYGKGLWSTMYGFVALSPDTETIRGLGFYEHGETPGLGGEIENPRWLALWPGKQAFDEDFDPAIEVIKGSVDSTTPNNQYKVDGLSGATITANGVTGMMQYWLSDDAYGPYLENLRESRMAYTENHMNDDSVDEEGSL